MSYIKKTFKATPTKNLQARGDRPMSYFALLMLEAIWSGKEGTDSEIKETSLRILYSLRTCELNP